ncbi:TIGR03619 family F420-dependent LLM class oxidoreductase [Amycolatopsis rhabdoformis]|uniref:TIGR03619 family F420-dependent LLM class oxidoreductase n=1 Tax=Amycolatopsis rhabdoformis TaxID=1448059 RepID=A0ABZ1ICV4_9PSEU|nr:TIGR03619 family F420-dependent LLM class oxidoreductase [Amycolatopsis rhabdoformis]WSE32232.1 TIGR03619 family F420-dependent LLM class oxidoreductase [Amycolatopsis rhabdoformis]
MPQQGTAGVRPTVGLFSPIVQPINLQPWEDAAGPRDLAAVVTAAEHLGFDFVTVCDHAVLSADEAAFYGGARFYDPIATIGYLAALTERIRFATHVYQIPLRSPLITAKSFATLDVLSGGRVIAGFGVGRRDYEAAAAGIDFRTRGSVADEYLRAVVALWSGEPTSFHGEHTDFTDLVCRPRPVQRPGPHVWVGGDRYVGLRRALDLGSAWAPWALTPAQTASLLDRAATERAGSVPAGFQVVVPVAPLGGRAARGQAAPPRFAPGPAAAANCLDVVEEWLGAGATDFVVDLPSPSLAAQLEAMAWFAAEVVPGLVRDTPEPVAGARS